MQMILKRLQFPWKNLDKRIRLIMQMESHIICCKSKKMAGRITRLKKAFDVYKYQFEINMIYHMNLIIIS